MSRAALSKGSFVFTSGATKLSARRGVWQVHRALGMGTKYTLDESLGGARTRGCGHLLCQRGCGYWPEGVP